jgi:hypothetical protein
MKIDYINIFFNKRFLEFIKKLIAIYIVFIGFTYFLFYKFESKSVEKYQYGIVKIYLRGLITNPETFIMSSDVYYKNGNFKNSMNDLVLAIGIYEKNGNNPEKVEELRKKVFQLKQQIDKKENKITN